MTSIRHQPANLPSPKPRLRAPMALRRRLASERGLGVIWFVLVLFIGLILVSVAATQALTASDFANRDLRSKRAAAAAEGGLDAALYRMNMLAVDARVTLGVIEQCIVPSGGLLQVSPIPVSGVCPPVEEDLGNGVRFSYQVMAVRGLPQPCLLACVRQFQLTRRVVSTGSVDCPGPRCIKRRIMTDAKAPPGGVQGTLTYILGILGDPLRSDLELQLYERESFVECTPNPPDPADPDSGC